MSWQSSGAYGFMAGLTYALMDRVWRIGRDRILNDNPAAVGSGPTSRSGFVSADIGGTPDA